MGVVGARRRGGAGGGIFIRQCHAGTLSGPASRPPRPAQAARCAGLSIIVKINGSVVVAFHGRNRGHPRFWRETSTLPFGGYRECRVSWRKMGGPRHATPQNSRPHGMKMMESNDA
jgi:hypothetical protein